MELKLTSDRIQKLKPSEIIQLKADVQTADGLKKIVEAFASYLSEIHSPDAVDIDDIYRLASEMNTIGLWRRVSPKLFVLGFQPYIDDKVYDALTHILHVQIPTERSHVSRKKWDVWMPFRKASTRDDFVVTYRHLPEDSQEKGSMSQRWTGSKPDILMHDRSTGQALVVESSRSKRKSP